MDGLPTAPNRSASSWPPETLGRKGFAPVLYNYNMEDITGLEMWLESERVQAKIASANAFPPFNDFLEEKGPVLVRPGGALSKPLNQLETERLIIEPLKRVSRPCSLSSIQDDADLRLYPAIATR
jgi:hypothetical protein